MSIIYINPYQFAAAAGYDTDAQTYITAVEAADGQALEVDVKDAINDFVVGCKADGIWSAIKASCILAGARTLAGALVPLVGTAPTNNNFVAGDYDRETGLLGDGSTKYLDSNRAANAEPTGNYHMAVNMHSAGSGRVIGAYDGPGTADDFLNLNTVIRNRSVDKASSFTISTGLYGTSRDTLNSFVVRNGGINIPGLTTLATNPGGQNMFVFAQNDSGSAFQLSNGRFNFYSIGESLDLALLDARVTTLMSDLAAAIP